MTAPPFDCAVVGLGAAGAATLRALAHRGLNAIGIDRYDPPHTRGSSHGETRITRLSLGEGAAYVPLAQRSHAIWRALEAQTRTELFDQRGLLLIGRSGMRLHGQADFLGTARAALIAAGAAFEELDAATTRRRFPAFAPAADEHAILEPGGGLLYPERCVAALLADAARNGATIRPNTTLRALTPRADAVTLETDAAPIAARQVVLACGPWIAPLAPELAPLTAIHPQYLHWFEARPEALADLAAAPVFIWTHGTGEEDSFYGFPALPGGTAAKIAGEQYTRTLDPDTPERNVPPDDAAALYAAQLAHRLPGLTGRVARSVACLYTVTPDRHFIAGRLAADPRLYALSPCSGHGFKHAAGLGEAVAAELAGTAPFADLSPFRPGRFRR